MAKTVKYIILLAVALNLISSGLVSFAQTSTSTVDVTPCLNDCVVLEVPSVLAGPGTTQQFIDNDPQPLYLYGNYALGQQVNVIDSRVVGLFTLSATMSDLVHSTDNALIIPYANIGIASFNDSNVGSVDGSRVNPGNMPDSEIDPVFRGIISEPFSQTDLLALFTSTVDTSSYYSHFTGTTPVSDTLRLINATSETDYLGIYNFGMGLRIDLPVDSVSNLGLREGIYQGELTFTLNEL